jgi:hypothetical protein
MPENEMWKTEVERRARDLPGLGEAMHDAARLASAFLPHDRKRVVTRATRVDDERFAGAARRADVRAKPPSLPLEVPDRR